jgi:ABC-type branched-subunit amino acid transport system substrate-binding protein
MKKYNKVLLTFLFCTLLIPGVYAQEDYAARYIAGKDFFKTGKYNYAMEQFKPLTTETDAHPFVQYAHYYYSLSAFKANLYPEATQMLRQLMIKYPDWDKIDDAYYILANIAFEQKKYRDAMKYLLDRDKDIKEDADKMKLFYLNSTPVDTLKTLNKIYPSDPVLGKVLATKLSITTDEKDKMLLEYLIQDFSLDRNKLLKTRKTVLKASYNVAVLFPFMMKDLNPENPQRPNQFVLDLYEGIKLAVDSLKRKGVNINLYPYDTEKDISKVTALLQLPELAFMDMIIGPIYPGHNALVNEFAYNNQICIVNPLSNNSKLMENNPFVFLYQSTLEDEALNLSDYAFSHFTNPSPKNNNVMIFFADDYKDSLLALRYKEAATAQKFNVTVFEKAKIPKVQQLLSDSVQLSYVSHIFVSSDDLTLAANVISKLEVSQMAIPLITKEDWLEFRLLSFAQLERRQAYFLHPDYLDYGKPAVKNFKRTFTNEMNLLPTNFAYEGYDLMFLFGNALKMYGNYFRDGIQKAGFIPGKIFPGYDYTNSNSNKFVPITKFEDQLLAPVNLPLSEQKK